MSRARAATLLLAAALAASCLEQEEEPKILLPTGLRPTPVDTTEPGELAEGPPAFGFPVPREMRIEARLEDAWFAEGALRLEDVANYVRERVEPARVETGPSKTVFLDAAVIGVEGARVRVEVAEVAGGVEMVVRQRKRKPAEKGLTEKERWEQVGMRPDGQPLPGRAE